MFDNLNFLSCCFLLLMVFLIYFIPLLIIVICSMFIRSLFDLNFMYSVILYITYLIFFVTIAIFYLGFGIFILKKSFEHAEGLIYLLGKDSDNSTIDEQIKLKNTLMKYFFLNICFLIISAYFVVYLNYWIVKIPLVLYICWTLGFIASFPINKEIIIKHTKDEIKDLILAKSLLNTVVFLIGFSIIKYFI